jgi:zona occludens toxin (predicted ATPase)
MKPVAIVGTILLALGLFGLMYGGLTYLSHDTVIDVGPIHATADREKTIPLSPLLGLVAAASGVVLLRSGSLRRSGARS